MVAERLIRGLSSLSRALRAPTSGRGIERAEGAGPVGGAGQWLRGEVGGCPGKGTGGTLLGPAESAVADREAAARDALAHCSLVTAPSASLLQWFETRFGLSVPRQVLPNPVAQRPAQRPPLPGLGEPARPLHVGFVGALIPTKGALLLLEAVERLGPGRVDVSLVGPAPPFHRQLDYPTRVEEAARKVGARILGPLSPSEVDAYLLTLDLVVVPSIWPENAPLIIREAHRVGRPVIGARVGGIPELIQAGQNGLLFSPGSVEALARELGALIDDPGRLALLAEGAWGTPLPALEEVVARWEGVYRSV